MAAIRVLDEAQLRDCVSLDANAVACVEDCFRALADGSVTMPPIQRLDIAEHNGEVDVKTAYIPGVDHFAIKISPGFFDNPALGLPSVNGLMVLLSARTGLVQALLLDNGYLTDVRTAAAGAVAAKWLARADARRAAVIGAGVQARLQVQALTLVRPLERAIVWARDSAKAAHCAAALRQQCAIETGVAARIDEAVTQADIVVTATPSRTPLLETGMLRPGQHLTAVGADAEHKNELAPAIVAAADCYVCDRLAQARVLGELHHAIAAGCVAAEATFAELGQVITGQRPGRRRDADITVCDLTGTGAQDTAIANFAYARAEAAGLGTVFQS